MGDVLCLNEEKSLLLFVDVKDILNQKVKLDNTNSWDSIELKNKQVGNNIINNSWVLYNKIFNLKIYEEIEKRIPSINDIECNEYNENELVNVRTRIKRKTSRDFNATVISKYNDDIFINNELDNVLTNYSKKYFEKQQQSTTMFLEFKGRNPNKFVLNRLEKIGSELDASDGVIFSRTRLKELIKDLLNPDKRTFNDYFQCLTNSSNILNVYG